MIDVTDLLVDGHIMDAHCDAEFDAMFDDDDGFVFLSFEELEDILENMEWVVL